MEINLDRAIRIGRAQAGINSFEALAKLAGLSRDQVWRLKSGNSDPKLSVLQKLAAACGVSLSAFLAWGEEGAP